MGIEKVELTESDLVEEILLILEKKESYPREIAETTDSHANTVSDYIKFLRENGLIERSKRTKAQYYKITEEGKKALDRLMEAKSEIKTVRNQVYEVFTS